MSALVSAYDRPEWRVYEQSPEFQEYIAAKGAWEAAHDKYVNASAEGRADARLELVAAEKEMLRLLEICRRTPEHLAATGWGGPPPTQHFSSLKAGDTFKAFPRAPMPHLAPIWVELDEGRAILEANFTGALDVSSYRASDIFALNPSDEVSRSTPAALMH